MRRYLERGFTLLELLLAITLLGILVAFAWPSFSSVQRSEHLGESARRMSAMVAMCRAEAMNEGCRYRVKIRLDGSVRVQRQLDPIIAPHRYVTVRAGWMQTHPLLDDVWVERVQILPEGPPPILIVDDLLEFPEMEIDPLPIEELDEALSIDFEPDGSCNSLRWVLRDERGRGLLMTLDGRLGRVTIEEWESVQPEDLVRPEPLPDDEEEEEDYDLEDYR